MVENYNIFTKLYRKIFRPNGVVLGDVREYSIGDDTRFINWNVSARMNGIFVDSILSDSGNDIIPIVDISNSMYFGTNVQSKISLAADILNIFIRLAERNHDRVGLVLFSDKIDKYYSPRVRCKFFQRVIQQVVDTPSVRKTNLVESLKVVNKVVNKKSVLILFCDIFALSKNRKSVLSQLHVLQPKHEVIVFAMTDPHDILPANIGKVIIEDSETGEFLEINTNNMSMMTKISETYSAYETVVMDDIFKLGIKIFSVSTKDSATKFLYDFFHRKRDS